MVEFDQPPFDEFFNAIRLFSWILDTQGNVIKANLAAQKLTGLSKENATGVPLWSVRQLGLSRENRTILKWAVDQAMTGNPVHHDLEFHRRGQPGMTISFALKPILWKDNRPQYIVAEGRDISAFKRTAEALNQSEARFKTIFEEAGIGIVIKDITGRMLDCNPAFQSMLGYSAEEIGRFDYLDLTYPNDRKLSRKLFNELINGKRKSYVIEKRYLHRNGQPIWARITASLVVEQDHQAQFVIAMVENIHVQKEIENELRELQQRLMQGREMERLRLAQDLHDGPLQEIIEVIYQFKELEDSPIGEAQHDQLMNVQEFIHQLARSIRTICGELRPPTLVPFGLEKTIRSHAEQYTEAHPEVIIKLDLEEDGLNLSEPIRIVLFRIYQVALNNIMRHAQATQIKIQFKLIDGQAVLKIQDNGVGFDLPERWIDLARQGHLGIVGARERAREVGGDLEVITRPGKGTIIQAVVPCSAELTGNPNLEAAV